MNYSKKQKEIFTKSKNLNLIKIRIVIKYLHHINELILENTKKF
jgi:hypothetical protein